jgi:large subunit ribosomal protein L18
MKNVNLDRTDRRRKRISANINGMKAKPRISVFRSNKYMYGQAIDDENRVTIAAFSSAQLKKSKDAKVKKTEEAKLIGIELGKILKNKKIKTAIFDRNAYAYKGRVKELCEGLREAGIQI